MREQRFETVDAYIASFPSDVQVVLENLRAVVRGAVPRAEETVSYDMPTYSAGGTILVFFAGWKSHVALYAVPGFGELDPELEAEVAPLRAAKDTVKFSLAKPVPYELARRIVEAIVAERGINPG
jgi:uncharacterized protein YdhG (YjbR/CyaY superfamily)